MIDLTLLGALMEVNNDFGDFFLKCIYYHQVKYTVSRISLWPKYSYLHHTKDKQRHT